VLAADGAPEPAPEPYLVCSGGAPEDGCAFRLAAAPLLPNNPALLGLSAAPPPPPVAPPLPPNQLPLPCCCP